MEFKFNSLGEKESLYKELIAANDDFTSSHKLIECNRRSKHLDFFLEVQPSFYQEKNKKTVVCLLCIMEKKYKGLTYSSSGCLTSHLSYHHNCKSSDDALRTRLREKISDKFVSK